MNKHANAVKNQLFTLIRFMSKTPEKFVKNPGKDFIRTRKLPFESVVKLLISMGGNSVNKELLEACGYDLNTATTSAFVQQRDKVLPSAFEFLFQKFTETHSTPQKHYGYRVLAADGSDLKSIGNPKDADSHFQNRPGEKCYNLTHFNALYDLCSKIYVDAIAEPRRITSERRAFIEMVNRCQIKGKVIITADRGYEGYNILAHIEQKGWNYVVRVKDLERKGIVSTLNLPADDEFDVRASRVLTRKHTNEVKENPDVYKFLPSNSPFDFLDDKKFYPISFRVVRFKIGENSYETLLTNLDINTFPAEKIKEFYQMGWGIETAFRKLKYTIGLTNFHEKKQAYIVQEIFARLIMYNFTQMITARIIIQKANKKHNYQVNFTVAVYICRRFLRNQCRAPDIETLILHNILPVREGRKSKRKVFPKSVVSFNYRVA